MNRPILILLLWCVNLAHAFDNYYATSFQTIADQIGLDWGWLDEVYGIRHWISLSLLVQVFNLEDLVPVKLVKADAQARE